jgi:hypothetical protein
VEGGVELGQDDDFHYINPSQAVHNSISSSSGPGPLGVPSSMNMLYSLDFFTSVAIENSFFTKVSL